MYLQHQLSDGAKVHLPGDASHLIYHTPVSGTATDGQICHVPCFAIFHPPLHFYIQQAWFLQWQKRQEASHTLLESEPQKSYYQNNRSVNEKFPWHPFLGFVGMRWERWNTNPYKYLISHSPGILELPILCLTGIKYLSLTQTNKIILVRVLCEVFQASL